MESKAAIDLLVRQESELDHLSTGENYADDLDMIQSPKDGKLVAVAVVGGVHVCWNCFGQFVEDPTHKLRPVEYNCGGYGTRIHIHAACADKINRKGRSWWQVFWSKVTGHQARRANTRMVKPFLPSGD